jgi:hypothetical protein
MYPQTQKRSGFVPETEIPIRIAELFQRRLTTPWLAKESKAFRAIGEISVQDLDCIEAYYESERAKGDKGIHRRDLATFLNNYQGELDRARDWESTKANGRFSL